MRTERAERIVAAAFWRPEMLSAFPRVGPTETIIDALGGWEREGSSSVCSSSSPGLGRVRLVERAFGPDGPCDSGDLVGQSHRGAVVAPALFDRQSPGLEPVGILGSGHTST